MHRIMLDMSQEKIPEAKVRRPSLLSGDRSGAGGLFEALAVENGDVPPTVFDKACPLERACNQRDRRPPCAKHLRQKLLGQINRGRLGRDAVLRLQQPACQPGLGIVNGIASCDLLGLDPEHFGIFSDNVLDAGALDWWRARTSLL